MNRKRKTIDTFLKKLRNIHPSKGQDRNKKLKSKRDKIDVCLNTQVQTKQTPPKKESPRTD